MRLQLTDLPKHMQDQVAEQFYGTIPNLKHSSKTSNPKLERSAGNESLEKDKAKKGDSSFYRISVKSYRTRLLDTDNLASKWHVDALRYAGIISNDSPDKCSITTTQQKVKKKEDERTEIEIVIT